MDARLPTLVTFDCAQTLVEVDWRIDEFARTCLGRLGVETTEAEGQRYAALYRERFPEFLEINRRRDAEEGAQFWRKLGLDWLLEIGQDAALLGPLVDTAEELAYGEDSRLFRVYPDAIPCLQRIRGLGIRTAVISNWDYSLHRVLRMFGLHEHLEGAFASLEEGVEKPDPRLFEIALLQLGVRPEETVHVGDDPVDDGEGARAAGIRSILIDRTSPQVQPPTLRSLEDLIDALPWTD